MPPTALPELEGELVFTESRYPGRHRVEAATLLSGGASHPVVVKKTRTDWRQRLKRKTKAERSFEIARELLARGLPTPEPLGIRVLEGESWFVARQLEGASEIRRWFLHRDGVWPEPPPGLSFEQVVLGLGALARRLHDSGVFFRDLSDGNVLVTSTREGPVLWLVDLNRATFSDGPVGLWRRLRDLSRPGLNRPEDVELLLRSYSGSPTAPRRMLLLLRAFRLRLVLWDRFKGWVRPWRSARQKTRA